MSLHQKGHIVKDGESHEIWTKRNWKDPNHRDTCKAVDAGYIEFDGLPGVFKTGCTNTPAFMQRFCPDHIPRVCTVSSMLDEEMRPADEAVVDTVLEKKSLRSGTYYKVSKDISKNYLDYYLPACM